VASERDTPCKCFYLGCLFRLDNKAEGEGYGAQIALLGAADYSGHPQI
jgi:hypothetical protein